VNTVLDSKLIAELAARSAAAASIPDLLGETVPLLGELAGASAVMVFGPGAQVIASSGSPLPHVEVEQLELPTILAEIDVPAAWAGQEITAVAGRRLHGASFFLLMAWAEGPVPQTVELLVTTMLLDSALARLSAEEELADLSARVDNAQHLANMGDYDWHISTDTNRWSDQLYRIYGHDPQSFNASYEVFLSHLHPEDRERIQALHQSAYASGEPYQMVERIIRPDGELRYLSSNGQVVLDSTGTPVRMRGTCIDITDRMLAEQGRERLSTRFRALVEACPDAIVVFDRTGSIVQANGHATQLLGGDTVGRSVEEILPLPSGHVGAAGIDAVGLDGRRLQLDVATAPLSDDESDESHEGLVAGFLRDAGPRLQGEATAARLREAQVRRRQALELNDSVIQGLTAASLANQVGDEIASKQYLGRTLTAARHMMNEWLDPLEGADLEPGDLVRTGSSDLARVPDHPQDPTPTPARDGSVPPRILLVDDNTDVRRLLRTKLEATGAHEIVGEAADGEEAIEMAQLLQPDVVLLDLAMPHMDGLQALPHILTAVTDVRVIVLSGFDQETMADKAFALGAHAYLEKGLRMDIEGVIQTVLSRQTSA
jgi:PAS domain S-box-containing protein